MLMLGSIYAMWASGREAATERPARGEPSLLRVLTHRASSGISDPLSSRQSILLTAKADSASSVFLTEVSQRRGVPHIQHAIPRCTVTHTDAR